MTEKDPIKVVLLGSEKSGKEEFAAFFSKQVCSSLTDKM